MSKSKREKRTEQKMTRFTKSELAIVERRADERGMAVATFLRKQALRKDSWRLA